MPFFLLNALRSFFTMVSVNGEGRFAAVNVNFFRRVGVHAFVGIICSGMYFFYYIILYDDDEKMMW